MTPAPTGWPALAILRQPETCLLSRGVLGPPPALLRAGELLPPELSAKPAWMIPGVAVAFAFKARGTE
jgi:hypothetical protein